MNPSIFIVWLEDPDSPSGISITGIFQHRVEALRFAESEGPEYEVIDMPFGPIDWQKLFWHKPSSPPLSWDM